MVAILGVLAAVVIPNVGRFIGAGEDEAAATELSNIQSAVTSMMVDNALEVLPNPVAVATGDMGAFPDATSDNTDGTDPDIDGDKVNDPNGDAYTFPGDKVGYILFQHDLIGDGAQTGLVNYVATDTTKGTYTVNVNGTVIRATTGYE